MRKLSPDQISDYIISFAHSKGDVITNLKLQKLLFYSQAWFLALNDEPIFDEDFEAWVHGPVLVSQYQRFRDYSYNPISDDISEPDLPKDVKDHLNEIMNVFGGEGAYALERMVHQEKPWLDARGSLPPDTPSQRTISKESMQAFYKQLSDSSDE